MLKRLFLIVSLVALVGISTPKPLFAASGAQGLQLAPTIIELDAIQGNSYTVNIKVRNVTADTLAIRSAVNMFSSKDETGTPKILSPEEEPKEPELNFRSWVTTISKFDIAPRTEKSLAIKITVPVGAGVGGHYGVIRFYGLPPEVPDDANAVALNASIGTLVLVKVGNPKDIKEALNLSELYITKNGKKTNFVEAGPITIASRFENTGNVHVKPEGLLIIKNMFGKTVASLPISDISGNVLPESTRKFEQTVKNKWLFGKYSVTLNATYGTSSLPLKGSVSFWAIPYKLIIVSLVTVAGFIIGLRKIIRYYNARIIAKHSKKN